MFVQLFHNVQGRLAMTSFLEKIGHLILHVLCREIQEGGLQDASRQESPPPEDKEFEDDDGTVYVWDSSLRKFQPKADGAPPVNYGVEDMTFEADEEQQPAYAVPVRFPSQLNITPFLDMLSISRRRRSPRNSQTCPSYSGQLEHKKFPESKMVYTCISFTANFSLPVYPLTIFPFEGGARWRREEFRCWGSDSSWAWGEEGSREANSCTNTSAPVTASS